MTSPAIAKLKDVKLFKDLSQRELDHIEKYHLQKKNFQKGEFLSLEDEPCSHIFIIQSGSVEIFRTAYSGKKQIIEILNAGDTCACNPECIRCSCPSSVMAILPTTVWFMSRESYIHLVNSNLELTRKINLILSDRIKRLNNLLSEVLVMEPDKRLIKFMVNLITEPDYEHWDGDYFYIPLTHEEIASRVGLARETVTRHLNKFKDLKLIDIKTQRITLLNRQKLEAMNL